MQTRRGTRDSKCTGWRERYQGAGAKRRRSRTGSKSKAKWVGVCLVCLTTLLPAGVTLAPLSRGQYWRQTGLVWRVWGEVKGRGRAQAPRCRCRCSSSKLCPVTYSQSHVCDGQIGRLADRSLTGRRTNRHTGTQIGLDGQRHGLSNYVLWRQTVWTEIRPACYTALGWCSVRRLGWLAHLMDQGQGDLDAEMSRAAIS